MATVTPEHKLTYQDLITVVQDISPEAADYLRGFLREPDQRFIRRDIASISRGKLTLILDAVLHWAETPQGQKYWMGIQKKLRSIEQELGL